MNEKKQKSEQKPGVQELTNIGAKLPMESPELVATINPDNVEILKLRAVAAEIDALESKIREASRDYQQAQQRIRLLGVEFDSRRAERDELIKSIAASCELAPEQTMVDFKSGSVFKLPPNVQENSPVNKVAPVKKPQA